MRLTRLWLTDFRSYASAELAPAPAGLTVIVGANGEGKTNLLEAVGWLATLSSFRGAPNDALVRSGATTAVVRAEGEREGRSLLIEAEIGPRPRVQVNRQATRRARDLLGALRVTVFSPDDLVLVKGGPAERRRYLDDVLVAMHPKWDALQRDVERILRQRTSLLKQALASRGERGSRRLAPDVEATLDVWDAKLAVAGSDLADGREALVRSLAPVVAGAYDRVAPVPSSVTLTYARSWTGSLASALAASRTDDLRRAVTSVGPHRDELTLTIAGLPARTHASQGEQRSLALALRLGGHEVVRGAVGEPPILLLDDVFSELDPQRSRSLLASLPPGQALLTTAGALPAEARPERLVHVRGGTLVSEAA